MYHYSSYMIICIAILPFPLRPQMQDKLGEMQGRYERSLEALERAWRENQAVRDENDSLHKRVADLDIRMRCAALEVSLALSIHEPHCLNPAGLLDSVLNRVKKMCVISYIMFFIKPCRGCESSVDCLRDGVAVLQHGVAEDLRASLQQLCTRVDGRDHVHQQLASMIHEVDDGLRSEIQQSRRAAQEDALALKRENDGLMSEIASVRQWCKQLEGHLREDIGRIEPRVNQLAVGIEARVQGLVNAHATSAQALETLVRSSLTDLEDMRATLRAHENALMTARRAQTETQDALFRSSQVFANALHIDPPVSASVLAAVGTGAPGLPASALASG